MTCTKKWHIFIYKECKYTCTCMCTCNCTSIQKLEIFMRNNHSSFKHFPVGSQYMSLLSFYVVECHTTEHASYISQTFLAKPLMIFYFSSNTEDFHSSCICSQKYCWSGLHLYLCFCQFLLILFNFNYQSWSIVVISGTVHRLLLKTSFHPLLWTSSGLTGSWKTKHLY